MNRDTTILQVAALFIVIAVLGVAIFNKQTSATPTQESNQENTTDKTIVIQPVTEGSRNAVASGTNVTAVEQPNSTVTNSFIERMNSPRTNLVKQYFAAITSKDYTQACNLLSNDKCAGSRPGAVANFSREFEKLTNGYEYISIKDFDITAPSGKSVVCVKYSYRYIDDSNPTLTSEILSFYINEVDGSQRITDRVCEKKYKEGRGNRPCPIEPNARFCEGKIK